MCRKLIYLVSFVLLLGLATDMASADPYRQDIGPDGIVCIEAENFDDNILKGASYWEFVTSTDAFTPPDGFSGGGAMQSMPDTPLGGGPGFDTGYVENAPRLDYEINFEKTGIYYVWILAYGMDGNSDSCHAGMDFEETPLSNRMSGWSGSYSWGNDRYERPEPSQIEITTTGVHTLNIYQREDGLTVDKIVLTTNPDYTPTGIGPEESWRGLRLKAYNPVPDDGAMLEDTWVSPIWSTGETAVSHDMYLGDNFDDVNDGAAETFQGSLPSVFFVVGFPGMPYPDGLVPGTTYYWRVDEVEADGTTIHKGDVWRFTIPPRIAYDPNPADGTKFVETDVELSWTAGLGAKLHHVYFGDNFDDVNAGAGDTYKSSLTDLSYSPGTLDLDKTYYWRVDEFALSGTYKGDIWSFRTLPEIPITDPHLVGWWKLDKGAVVFDWSGHGNHGTLQGDPQWVAGFDGDALEFDGNGDYVELPTGIVGSDMGSVSLWFKTTQAERGMMFYGSDGTSGDGYGDQNELHVNVENGGVVEFLIEGGDTDVSIESSVLNDDSWHHIAATWDINGQANLYVDGGAPISVEHIGNDFNFSGRIRLGQPNASTRYYAGLLDDVRVYDYVLSPDDIAITMRGDVRLAWGPKPMSDSILSIDEVTAISWSPGDNAAQHDVYLGTDRDAVADANSSDTTGIYRGRQGATFYTPPEGIQWDQSHYWRIDEYNTDATITKGRIWSFAILDFLVIEDFEDYNDTEPDRIFDVWIDGWGTTTNGSTVGYPDPDWIAGEHYIETTIVHGGDQSMPYFYDNNFKYSEATKTLSYPRDWTKHGVGVLSLWFRGNPAGFLEEPAGTYTMTGAGSDIWNEADEFRYAYKQLSGDGSIVAQVLSVENTDPWAKAGVMIRKTLDAGSVNAMAYITPDGRAGWQYRVGDGGSSSSTRSDPGAITAPHWVKLTRQGNTITAQHSSDGVNWEDMVEAANPQEPSSRNILMNQNVYIGLALTSHSSGVVCKAELSNVQTTGTVTPIMWTHEAIGVDMAANDPEPMYVALNGSAVVYHDDPGAALIDTWTPWTVDLQKFAAQGVNLANVNTISIGFGDKNNIQAGGSGMVFFDDIRLYRPAEPQP